MSGLQAQRQAIAAITADKTVRRRILIACCLVSAAKLLQPPVWVFDPPRELPFDAAWSNYWLFSSLAGIAAVAFYLTGGVLGDLYGRRRLILIGLSGYVASNLLVMATPTPGWHLVTRFLALAFGALAVPLALAMINLVFDDNSRAAAIACFTVGNTLALQVAWMQGLYFSSVFGWRAPYVLPIVVAVLAGVLVVRSLPESLAGYRRLLDTVVYMGWTLIVLAAVFGLLAFPLTGDRRWIVMGAALVVASIGTALVVWWNQRIATRFVPRRRFRARDLTALLITGVILNFTLVGYSIRTFTYFEVERELPTVVAVLGLAPILVGSLAALFLFVRSVRKRQARLVIAAGMAAMTAAIALTALLPAGAPYLLYAVPLFVFGFGYLLAITVWLSAFLRTAVDGYYGLNAGINKAAALVGGALGAAVTGRVLALFGDAYYSNKLSQTGLSAEELAASLAAFNNLLAANSTNVQAVIQQAQQELAAGYLEAYAAAYDRVLWLMAGLCALCAIVILLGLRRSLRAEQAKQEA